MAVDEKYVEKVMDEEEAEEMYDDVLDEFGIEASYKPASNNGLDLDKKGYEIVKLSQLWANDEYEGKPVVSDVYADEYTDKDTGEVTIKHKVDLVLLNDDFDEPQAYVCPMNLSSDKTIVKNVSNKNGLYNLAMGLMELKAPGISKHYNQLDVVNIKRLQKLVKKYDTMTIRVVEEEFTDNSTKNITTYNSFRIIKVE